MGNILTRNVNRMQKCFMINPLRTMNIRSKYCGKYCFMEQDVSEVIFLPGNGQQINPLGTLNSHY